MSSSLSEKTVSACVGSLITCLVVTPFDVVKVRLQSQSLEQEAKYIGTSFYDPFHFRESRRVGYLPVVNVKMNYRGTLHGLEQILKNEGIRGLWTGLTPTLIMSIPATVIYLIGYDLMKEKYKREFGEQKFAPILLGGIARTVAASCISPIELIRTRMQSKEAGSSNVLNGIFRMVKEQGVTSLWKGLRPTLWRDVPFSAVYWACYEESRKHFKDYFVLDSFSNNLLVSFCSGACSGMIAATVTTPFDVAKTRRQVEEKNRAFKVGMWKQLKEIYSTDGFKGYFRGLSARVAKVSPACAIMISSYELGKKYFSSVSSSVSIIENNEDLPVD